MAETDPEVIGRRGRRIKTEVSRVETWFLEQGAPFIVRYAAGQRIIARMTPGLLLIFITGVGLLVGRLLTGDLERPLWDIVASTDFSEQLAVPSIVAGIALAVGIVAASWISRFRERRTTLLGASPGLTLVGGMLLICVVHVVIVKSVGAFLAELGVFAGLVILLFLFVRGGGAALTVWAARQAIPRYRDLIRLLTRALPLQLVLVAFLFINTEAWQVADALRGRLMIMLVLFFVAAALLFLISQIPRELSALDVDLSPAQIEKTCVDTPMERLAQTIDISAIHRHPLEKRERANLVLTLVFAQGLQILTLGLLMFLILIIFGTIAIQDSVIESWVGRPADPIVLFGLELPWVKQQLIRVAILVASFNALQFAVLAVTDAGYRTEFFDDMVGKLSDTLIAREVYLAGLEQHHLTPSSRRFSWRDLEEIDD